MIFPPGKAKSSQREKIAGSEEKDETFSDRKFAHTKIGRASLNPAVIGMQLAVENGESLFRCRLGLLLRWVICGPVRLFRRGFHAVAE